MTFYEQLGVAPTATVGDIKRAYFRLVKQFTPEKNPEEFMQIRKAYEELSDEQSRNDYDMMLSKYADAPAAVLDAILEANHLGSKGLFADAIRLLESKLKKHKKDSAEREAVLYVLCEHYLDAGKSGKAVDIAEELVKKHPDDAKYVRLAAEACHARGWTKRTYEYLAKLIRLDPGSEDAVLAFFDEMDQQPGDLEKIVETIEMHGGKAPMLCVAILSERFFANPAHDGFEQYSQMDLFSDPDKDEYSWHDLMFAAKKLAEHTVNLPEEKKFPLAALLQLAILRGMYDTDRYDILPHIDQVIENIGVTDVYDSPAYLIASTAYDAIGAVQAGIPKMLAAHSVMRYFSKADVLSEYDRADYRMEVIAFETEIMMFYQSLKKDIARYRDEFGRLYEHSADFLNAIGRYNEQKMFEEVNRRFAKLKDEDSRFTLEWLGEDDDFDDPDFLSYMDTTEPVERQEPVRVTKVGRNEPCPCGSGKKYKKCCGA